jgi:putative ABC transport system ATP-binding protein
MEQKEIVYSLRGISRIYKMGETLLYALNKVDLDIYRGEFLVVTGPSGSGKSTLLNVIGGMDRSSEGEIKFGDFNLTRASDRELTIYRRNEIGFVFQFFNLLPTLTALENVDVVAEIATEPMEPIEALKLVGLTDRKDHFPSQMSGGEQQRVAIARALASTPQVLLCDEPTGSLDSKMSERVLSLLIEICRKFNKNVVMITHNLELTKIGDRIVKIKDGHIEDIVSEPNPLSAKELTW